MRTLIIPDLHHHTQNADDWLRRERYDRVVFLGDYFDDFGDDVSDARKTAVWLRNRMEATNDVFLLGNHDAAYMFSNLDALYCPGFTRAKAKGIHDVLQPKHWRRFKLAHLDQGWLLSHGGVHPSWPDISTAEAILCLCDRLIERASNGVADPRLSAGCDRGGAQPVGSPLWLDWNSFVPIPGINQIVGHTPAGEVREKHDKGSHNYCLDVKNGTVAAMLVDGWLEILTRL